MKLKLEKKEASLYIPDGMEVEAALGRTTHLCIAAHQDDIEIMAASPIVECFGKSDKWFSGVVVTDGAGSPRSGIYGDYTDEEMKVVRKGEQITASIVGQYAAQFQLYHPSSEVKDNQSKSLVNELAKIIEATKPEVLFTHNLADKHDTHVAVALRTIAAVRSLPKALRPKQMYILEVWRGLDWVNDNEKKLFDTSTHQNLQEALLGVFDSQIAGGKKYGDAAMGRRLANATFYASHDTDSFETANYGIEITDMVNDESINPTDFIGKYIDRFKNDVLDKLKKFGA